MLHWASTNHSPDKDGGQIGDCCVWQDDIQIWESLQSSYSGKNFS